MFANPANKSTQLREIYLIKANDLNSQQLAFISTVNIGSGDTQETWGDPSPRLDLTNQLGSTVSIGKVTNDARLS